MTAHSWNVTNMTARGWSWDDWRLVPNDRRLPPDLTPNGLRVQVPPCPADYFSWLPCTRREGHTGRHAAGNGAVIIAVWEDTP